MSVQAVLLLVAIPLVLLVDAPPARLELGDDLAAGLGLPVKRTVNMLVAAAVPWWLWRFLLRARLVSWRWLPPDCAPPVEHSGYGDVAFGVAGFGDFGAG